MSIVGRLCVESNVPLEAGSLIRFNASTKPNTIKVDEQGAHAGVLLERHPGYNKLVWSGVHLEGPINVAISSDGAIIKTLDPLYITWNGEAFAVTLSSDGSCLVGRSIQSCNPSLQATLAIDVRDNPPIIETSTAAIEPDNTFLELAQGIANKIVGDIFRNPTGTREQVGQVQTLDPVDKTFEIETGTILRENRVYYFNVNPDRTLELFKTSEAVTEKFDGALAYDKIAPIAPENSIPLVVKSSSITGLGKRNVTFYRPGDTPVVDIEIDEKNPPGQDEGSDVFIQPIILADSVPRILWGAGPGGFKLGTLKGVDDAEHPIIQIGLAQAQAQDNTQDVALKASYPHSINDIAERILHQLENHRFRTVRALADEFRRLVKDKISSARFNEKELQMLLMMYAFASALYTSNDTDLDSGIQATTKILQAYSDRVQNIHQLTQTRTEQGRTGETPREAGDFDKWVGTFNSVMKSSAADLRTQAQAMQINVNQTRKKIASDLLAIKGVPLNVVGASVSRGLLDRKRELSQDVKDFLGTFRPDV